MKNKRFKKFIIKNKKWTLDSDQYDSDQMMEQIKNKKIVCRDLPILRTLLVYDSRKKRPSIVFTENKTVNLENLVEHIGNVSKIETMFKKLNKKTYKEWIHKNVKRVNKYNVTNETFAGCFIMHTNGYSSGIDVLNATLNAMVQNLEKIKQ